MADNTILDLTPIASIPGDAIIYVVHNGIDYRMTKDEFLGAYKDNYLGSITPISTPSGSGAALWTATEAGTYTNFGGLVVNANSFAFISRNVVGAFSISHTSQPLNYHWHFRRIEAIGYFLPEVGLSVFAEIHR